MFGLRPSHALASPCRYKPKAFIDIYVALNGAGVRVSGYPFSRPQIYDETPNDDIRGHSERATDKRYNDIIDIPVHNATTIAIRRESKTFSQAPQLVHNVEYVAITLLHSSNARVGTCVFGKHPESTFNTHGNCRMSCQLVNVNWSHMFGASMAAAHVISLALCLSTVSIRIWYRSSVFYICPPAECNSLFWFHRIVILTWSCELQFE